MSTVDPLFASNKARECADRKIQLCYKPHQRDSMEANLLWAQVFRREFNALTQPSTRSEQAAQAPG